MDALKNGWLSGSYTIPSHHYPKIDVLTKSCLQIIIAAEWLVRHSCTSPNQTTFAFSFVFIQFFYGIQVHLHSTGMRRVRSFDQSSWRVCTVYQTFNICLPFYFKGSASQKFWTPYFCLKFISAGPWYTNQLFNACILLIFCYIRAQMSSFHWPKFR